MSPLGEVNANVLYWEVGIRIRAAREQKGISQERLAASIGLSRTSLTNIEQGKQKFLLHTFIAIADTLGVSLGQLLPSASSDVIKLNLSKYEQPIREFVERTLQPVNSHAAQQIVHNQTSDQSPGTTRRRSRAR